MSTTKQRFVKVNAPWSQKHGHTGEVVAEEDNEVVVNFGDSTINFRYQRIEVVGMTDMQKNKIVGKCPYDETTIRESMRLHELGIASEADGDNKVMVLRRESSAVAA